MSGIITTNIFFITKIDLSDYINRLMQGLKVGLYIIPQTLNISQYFSSISKLLNEEINEPLHQKTNNLHMQNQRRRSAVQ